MAADDATPAEPAPDALQQRWLAFRRACFICYGEVWVYAGAQPFDFYMTGLALQNGPGFDLQFSGQALCILAYGAQHWIPLAQMSADSLVHVQALVHGEQRRRTEQLRQDVTARWGFVDEEQAAPDGRQRVH